MINLSSEQKTEFEAAAFRRLLEHLRGRIDLENKDLLDFSGFCRNCLAKWYRAAAEEAGVELSKDDARELIYGMPYADWKEKQIAAATATPAG